MPDKTGKGGYGAPLGKITKAQVVTLCEGRGAVKAVKDGLKRDLMGCYREKGGTSSRRVRVCIEGQSTNVLNEK